MRRRCITSQYIDYLLINKLPNTTGIILKYSLRTASTKGIATNQAYFSLAFGSWLLAIVTSLLAVLTFTLIPFPFSIGIIDTLLKVLTLHPASTPASPSTPTIKDEGSQSPSSLRQALAAYCQVSALSLQPS